jgi:hypothetical protein
VGGCVATVGDSIITRKKLSEFFNTAKLPNYQKFKKRFSNRFFSG